MKRIGILYHPMKEPAYPLAVKLDKFLTAKGVSTWVCSAWEMDAARGSAEDTDLILSVGGDGTILRAAQIAIPRHTPVTGINLGNLGFMTELSVDEYQTGLIRILNGEGWIDERSLLEAELVLPGDAGKPPRKFFALNDVVLARGEEAARVIYVDVCIDGEALTTYKSDGVILATATGSTGYALAAGGPVLYPHSRDMVLLPIVPHLSASYSLVLPFSSVVKLHLSLDHLGTLSIDGHINHPLPGGAFITIKHSAKTVPFLRIHPSTSFYSTLEQRLKGKQ